MCWDNSTRLVGRDALRSRLSGSSLPCPPVTSYGPLRRDSGPPPASPRRKQRNSAPLSRSPRQQVARAGHRRTVYIMYNARTDPLRRTVPYTTRDSRKYRADRTGGQWPGRAERDQRRHPTDATLYSECSVFYTVLGLQLAHRIYFAI